MEPSAAEGVDHLSRERDCPGLGDALERLPGESTFQTWSQMDEFQDCLQPEDYQRDLDL